MASPPRIAPQWTDEELGEFTIAKITALFEDLSELSMAPDENGDLHPQFIGMSFEGKREWAKYYNEHQSEQVDLIGDEAAAWSKLIAYVPRFALLLHLMWDACDEGLVESGVVGESEIMFATQLVDWFKNEAARIYATIDDDSETTELRQQADWIRRKYPDGLTVAEYQRGHRRLSTAAGAESELNKLDKAGLGEWDNTDRKKRIFTVYPNVA